MTFNMTLTVPNSCRMDVMKALASISNNIQVTTYENTKFLIVFEETDLQCFGYEIASIGSILEHYNMASIKQ